MVHMELMENINKQSFSLSFSYPVCFTDNVFDPENPSLVQAISRLEADTRHKVIVFVDQGVLDSWPELGNMIEGYVQSYSGQLQLVSKLHGVPGGEQCKSMDSLLEGIYRQLHASGIDRHSVIFCIGGGAVLDLVGYAAATTHRGIRLVRIPTTVLAQNDAGIGVKNGINKFGVKNFIGTFHPPFAVINDFQFLNTLEERDRRAGLAEAVKVAAIRDAGFFEFLESNCKDLSAFSRESTEHMIRRCAELHLNQITNGGDPFESGSARPLDYGHWSAHKLESVTDFRLRHGEAVAIGMTIDARYAVEVGLLENGSELRIFELLKGLGFNLWDSALDEKDEAGKFIVLSGLDEFRKHLGGELTVTMPAEIGTGIEIHQMDQTKISQAIDWLRNRCGV